MSAFTDLLRGAWRACLRIARAALRSAGRALRFLRARLATLRGSRTAAKARSILAGGARVLVLGLLGAGLVLGSGALLLRRVPPGGVGVLQRRVGEGGVEARVRGPGLVLAPRGLWRLHVLDGRTQLVSFASAADGGDAPLLRVRTKDGNVAKVAASVSFRLREGEAWRLVAEGLRTSWIELARGAIERTLLVELANLSSDQLAATETRLERAAAALARLELELAGLSVEPLALAIHSVAFPPEYEATLQKGQLSRQLGRLDRADVQLEARELEVKRLEMDIELEVRERLAERERRIAELVSEHERRLGPSRAEAKAVRVLRAAEAEAELARLAGLGERLLGEAREGSERRRAELLATRGGALWLAREAALRLRLERVVLDSREARTPSVLRLEELVRALWSDASGPE